MVKNPPANTGDAGSVSGQEDLLHKEMTTHSSILAHRQRILVGYSPWVCRTARCDLVAKQQQQSVIQNIREKNINPLLIVTLECLK